MYHGLKIDLHIELLELRISIGQVAATTLENRALENPVRDPNNEAFHKNSSNFSELVNSSITSNVSHVSKNLNASKSDVSNVSSINTREELNFINCFAPYDKLYATKASQKLSIGAIQFMKLTPESKKSRI